MIDTKILYRNTSDALMQARYLQSQISQKEFELKVADVNTYYPKDNIVNQYANSFRKQSIRNEIGQLTNNRDIQTFNAIDNALNLAYIELQQGVQFSMAYLAISSINSFLLYERIKLAIPFIIQYNISQLIASLFRFTHIPPMLANEMNRLKNNCQIL